MKPRDLVWDGLDEVAEVAPVAQARRGRGPSRRSFLKIAGGLAVVARLPAVARAADAKAEPLAPQLYVRIEPDNRITLTIPKSEMGQGVRTSLALLLAEELEADWSAVRVATASFDPRLGDQGTGGSGSVWERFESLRQVGAALRIMLIDAAARRWKLPARDLRAEASHVVHAASGRRARFADVVEDALRGPVPKKPPLKPRDQWRLIGKEHVGRDVDDIVHGRASYGLDQRRPGMLFASIERPREHGATLERAETDAALAVPGVRQVVTLEPSDPAIKSVHARISGGVAVVATNTWAALEGRRRLKLSWRSGPHAAESTQAHTRDMAAAVQRRGAEEVINQGDPDAELSRASKVIHAEYTVPWLAHATLEPMNCTAHWDGHRMTLWSPTQFPQIAARVVAARLKLEPADVAVHVTLLGGGFGRRINPDFCVEAALVAREVKAPVQVMWTREDDLGHDFYRPCGHHRLEACLDERGYPRALRHRLCNPAIDGTYRGPGTGYGASEAEGIADSFYRIPHRKTEYTLLPSGVPRGWWRAVNTTHTVFAIESFIDELAEAARIDPLAYRLALIDQPPKVGSEPSDPETAFVPERMKRCLSLAAERAGWGKPVPAGHGVGLACGYDHLSYAAVVIEASVNDHRIVVHRVVCAADCGTVVHPNGARAQIEGAITHGLSAALRERITIDGGAVEQTNFHSYQLLRIHDAPAAIDVHFVDRPTVRVTGLGEPALPPVAPALANAIHRATGRRLRALPLAL